MVNTDLLKQIIKARNLTIDGIAADIKVDPSTLFRKFQNGGENFTVAQVTAIRNALQLTNEEVNQIFFVEELA